MIFVWQIAASVNSLEETKSLTVPRALALFKASFSHIFFFTFIMLILHCNMILKMNKLMCKEPVSITQ